MSDRPQRPMRGESVKDTVDAIIRYLPTNRTPKGKRSIDDQQNDTLPPFMPLLGSPDNGSTFTFTLTDGYVAERTNTPAQIWLPAGLSTAGVREQIAITAGEQISIIVDTDPDKVVTGVRYDVETEDTADIEADGGTVDGEYHFKLAVLRAATGSYDAYLELYLAGSHIYFDGGAGSGLTGYVTYIRDMAGGGTSYAKLYVRLISGRETEILDGWDGVAVVTPPGGWGAQLYEIAFFGAAGYGASNSNW